MTYLHEDKETLLPALPNILPKSPQIPVKTLSTQKETNPVNETTLIGACTPFANQFIILH